MCGPASPPGRRPCRQGQDDPANYGVAREDSIEFPVSWPVILSGRDRWKGIQANEMSILFKESALLVEMSVCVSVCLSVCLSVTLSHSV